MTPSHRRARLYVIAGVNGAGKSSVLAQAVEAAGGYDIPETKIRERYDRSRQHLVELLPLLTSLEVFDNTREAPPLAGLRPLPTLLLRTTRGNVEHVAPLDSIPEWAKPIAKAALRSREPDVARSRKQPKRR